MEKGLIFHGVDKVICRRFSSQKPNLFAIHYENILKCWLWRYEDEKKRWYDEKAIGNQLHPDKYFPNFITYPGMVHVKYESIPGSEAYPSYRNTVRVNISGYVKGSQLTCVVEPTIREGPLQFYSINCFTDYDREEEIEIGPIETPKFKLEPYVPQKYMTLDEKRRKKALARKHKRKKSRKRRGKR